MEITTNETYHISVCLELNTVPNTDDCPTNTGICMKVKNKAVSIGNHSTAVKQSTTAKHETLITLIGGLCQSGLVWNTTIHFKCGKTLVSLF